MEGKEHHSFPTIWEQQGSCLKIRFQRKGGRKGKKRKSKKQATPGIYGHSPNQEGDAGLRIATLQGLLFVGGEMLRMEPSTLQRPPSPQPTQAPDLLSSPVTRRLQAAKAELRWFRRD